METNCDRALQLIEKYVGPHKEEWGEFETAMLDFARAADGDSRPRDFLAWAADTFGPVALERRERLTRFVEEAIELAGAENMPRALLAKITERVYSSPPGETAKEIGQAQACLETFAESIGLSSANEAEREWQRVQSIPKEEWERRHAAKRAVGIAI